MAFGLTTILLNYLILTYWHRLALFNTNTLNLLMLWWLVKGCMGQRLCRPNAVVWITELVRVKKSLRLVEISSTSLF